MEEKNELPSFSEALRAPAQDPGEGLSTPAAGPDTYIGPTSSMCSVTTLSEHVSLQADQEQVLCRELVCVCDELQSCCEHAASAVTVHPRVQTLLLTRPSALLQAEEIEKFIIRQPPKGGKDDYDSENSWISDGLPSSSRRRRRGDGR